MDEVRGGIALGEVRGLGIDWSEDMLKKGKQAEGARERIRLYLKAGWQSFSYTRVR